MYSQSYPLCCLLLGTQLQKNVEGELQLIAFVVLLALYVHTPGTLTPDPWLPRHVLVYLSQRHSLVSHCIPFPFHSHSNWSLPGDVCSKWMRPLFSRIISPRGDFHCSLTSGLGLRHWTMSDSFVYRTTLCSAGLSVRLSWWLPKTTAVMAKKKAHTHM